MNLHKNLQVPSNPNLGKTLRQQLRYKRAQWGPQRSRHVSMLSAIQCCWGLPFKFVLVPESSGAASAPRSSPTQKPQS